MLLFAMYADPYCFMALKLPFRQTKKPDEHSYNFRLF